MIDVKEFRALWVKSPLGRWSWVVNNANLANHGGNKLLSRIPFGLWFHPCLQVHSLGVYSNLTSYKLLIIRGSKCFSQKLLLVKAFIKTIENRTGQVCCLIFICYYNLCNLFCYWYLVLFHYNLESQDK